MLVYARLGAFDGAALRSVYHYIEGKYGETKKLRKTYKEYRCFSLQVFYFCP
jgi:hypothetical protein